MKERYREIFFLFEILCIRSPKYMKKLYYIIVCVHTVLLLHIKWRTRIGDCTEKHNRIVKLKIHPKSTRKQQIIFIVMFNKFT